MKTEEEKSGVLNELIKRAGELIGSRTIFRRKSEEDTASEYDIQTHSISGFADNWLDFEDDSYMFADEIYTAYKIFCKTINTPPKKQAALGLYLRKELGLKKCQKGKDGKKSI